MIDGNGDITVKYYNIMFITGDPVQWYKKYIDYFIILFNKQKFSKESILPKIKNPHSLLVYVY